jgi:hypothetical protein
MIRSALPCVEAGGSVMRLAINTKPLFAAAAAGAGAALHNIRLFFSHTKALDGRQDYSYLSATMGSTWDARLAGR